jgi:hypothetical protein
VFITYLLGIREGDKLPEKPERTHSWLLGEARPFLLLEERFRKALQVSALRALVSFIFTDISKMQGKNPRQLKRGNH